MINGKTLIEMGMTPDPSFKLIISAANKFAEIENEGAALAKIGEVISKPEYFLDNYIWKECAKFFFDKKEKIEKPSISLFDNPINYKIWGQENIDSKAIDQMNTAMRLPVSISGALMPDAHVGYSVPIGGVVATDNCVIPYAVGVDISCRMHLTIFKESASRIKGWRDKLAHALKEKTAFGVGSQLEKKVDHSVMDENIWDENKFLQHLKDRAWSQLGSSGSGNHFVEFGEIELKEKFEELNIDAGNYIGLLSHSGSRNLGSEVCKKYTDIAIDKCNLDKNYRGLSWLSLESEFGQEYWQSMELCAKYAKANHEIIHRLVSKAANLTPIGVVQNEHNLAWIEEIDGRKIVVHRKGATPAHFGVLGIIPGSMGDFCHIVRGKGNPLSLNSASHGAGRLMGRKEAKSKITKKMVREYLEKNDIELISGGVDEAPQSYKRIEDVMSSQADLVESIGTFMPKIVMMSND